MKLKQAEEPYQGAIMPRGLKKILTCDRCRKTYDKSKIRIAFLLDGFGIPDGADFVINSNTFGKSHSSDKFCMNCYLQEYKSDLFPIMQN